MSYTDWNEYPEDFEYVIKDGFLHARFVCPRCDEVVDKVISFAELRLGYEISCTNEICGSSRRRGFTLSFHPSYTSSMLGLNDAPLKERETA